MTRFDANAWVGMWPFTASAPVSLADLTSSLSSVGISGAAVSPLHAVLAPEPMSANLALIDEAAAIGDAFDVRVVPIINPSLPGWERDLAQVLETGGESIGAIRIVPNYHGYDVDGDEALVLARAVAEAGLGLCIQLRMLDERAHHPLMLVPGVPIQGVARLAEAVPGLRILACGIYNAELSAVASAGNVSAELSSVESGDVLATALRFVPAERLMLGTHAPIYYPAAGVAKVAATAEDDDVITRIASFNAAAFFN